MKTTIRIAALATALAFGAATILPVMTSPAVAASTMSKKKMGGSSSVKAAQEALNKNGAILAVDGKMGPQTKAAIKSFQQSHGLKATGHLDKATKAALNI